MSNNLLVIGSVAYDCIETPLDAADDILGGSASFAALAASYFAPTSISAVVGYDFKKSDIERLEARDIDLSNLQIDDVRKTFFWRGKYLENFHSRETLDVQLNSYEFFEPALDDKTKKFEYILLGNISPEIQSATLDLIDNPKFVVVDTMDLWIHTSFDALVDITKRADMLILNDSEAKMFADDNNIICAGKKLMKMAKSVIIKAGEYGAMLFHKDGFFVVPAYPIESLYDPTGAGDSFAGALVGYIAGKNDASFETIKEAMFVASATASMTVESFSCLKLEENGVDEINRRVDYIKKITQV